MFISKSTKAWRQCGVEERWKGWQLLLRLAKSFSSRPFWHTRTARAGHFPFFSDGPPQRNKQHIVIRPGRVEGATRGKKKLDKSLTPAGCSLTAQDGLLHAAGIPRASLVWPESRSDKCRPVVQNDLTHFIDDQVEALVSIRERQNHHRH